MKLVMTGWIFRTCHLPLALRLWQGEAEAAGEWQAVQTATHKQLAGVLRLAPERYERYLSQDLTEEGQQQLVGQFQVTPKCGPGGRQAKPAF